MATASDNFLRPDGALGANWTACLNTAPVISNHGFTNGTGSSDNNSPTATFNGGVAFYNAVSFTRNHKASCVLTELGLAGTDCIPGVVVRASAAAGGSGYFLFAGRNTTGPASQYCIEVWSLVSGTATFLFGASNPILSVGDILELSIADVFLKAYYNGSLIFSAEDLGITSGQPGIVVGLGSPGTDVPAATTIASTWSAEDIPAPNVYTQLASDAFTEAGAIVDTFPYTNGDLHTKNANWVYQQGSLQVSGNKVFGSDAGITFGYRSDVAAGATSWSQIKFINGADANQFGSTARAATGAATSYFSQIFGSILRLDKDVAGSITVLDTFAGAAVTGDVISILTQGTAISYYLNGTPINTVTDTDIASGRVGVFAVGNNTTTGASMFAGGAIAIPANFSSGTGQVYANTPTNGAFALAVDAQSFSRLWENTATWPNDQYAECILTGPVEGSVGPAARLSVSQNTGYFFFPVVSNQVRLSKVVNGTETTLSTQAHTYASGQTYRIEVLGSRILCKINGITVIDVTDSSVASGKAGMLAFGDANEISGSAITKTFTTWAAGSITATFNISGVVGVGGATVTYTGTASGSVTADASGSYMISNLGVGSYTIIPSLAGYTFVPTSNNEIITSSDISGVNFTASLTPTVYSVIDSRNYGNFPNDSRDVQGTLTFDVPSVDSRAAGEPESCLRYWFDISFNRTQPLPVDSRIAPNIPENSRTFPPF